MELTLCGGCIKATIIYTLGCTAFFLGYYIKNNKKDKILVQENIDSKNEKKCIKIMIIIWVVCLSISIWYEVHALGRSISYIFSIGSMGQIDSSNIVETPLKFLINFSYSMVVPWLYILFKSKNNILKIAITILMLIFYIFCGWRFILVIMGLSYLVVYYSIKGKRPKSSTIVLTIVIALIAFTLIGNVRYSIRTGVDFKWYFDYNTIIQTLETNFNTYQPFYGVVKNYPEKYSYTLGEGMVYDTAITFMPRALWKSKPQPREFASMRAMRNSITDKVVDSAAMVMPNIGEIYVDFGIIGVILIMFLWGRTLKKSTRLYKTEKINFENIVTYSIVYALCFQFVTRGYMPNNFYLFIFMIWPVWVMKKFVYGGRI